MPARPSLSCQGRPIKESLACPVTALAFLTTSPDETVLLSGEDTQLRAYSLTSPRLLLDIKVFPDQSVHGIYVEAAAWPDGRRRYGRRILIWGGSDVAVLPVSGIEEILKSGNGQAPEFSAEVQIVRGKAPDRIYDGTISPFDGLRGSLATAHNEVVEVSWSEETGGGLLLGNILAPSRPFLYSASLRYISPETVLVAGGTVFGEVLVWKCDPHQRLAHCTLLHVFTGHEGSIFGVHLSDAIPMANCTSPRRLLASCSDDRTIRVWDVLDCKLESEGAGLHNGAASTRARETGFGANPVAQDEQQLEVSVAVAMGHISRIWQIKFPPPRPTGESELTDLASFPIYSFGEDSTSQRWCLDAPKGSLTHEKTFSNHDGKHIWSSAIMRSAGGGILVATGGADGKISLIDEGIPDVIADETHSTSNVTVVSHETLPLLETIDGPTKKKRHHDCLRKYAFVAHDSLLATTKFGKVLFGVFRDLELRWEAVSVDESFREGIGNCTVVECLGDGIAVLGTSTHQLFLYYQGAVSLVKNVPGNVKNIFGLETNETEATFSLSLQDSSNVKIYTLDLLTRSVRSETLLKDVDPRFILTSACLLRELLVLGSRSGFMLLFRREGVSSYSPSLEMTPRVEETITGITPLPGQENMRTGTVSFVTNHRDGNYRIYEASTDPEEPFCVLRHETSPPPFGSFIDEAWFVKQGIEGAWELMLSGFKSSNFIVWNETRREVVANVNCGGANRDFASVTGRDSSVLRFAYTKASKTYLCDLSRPKCRTIKPGAHGREIRAIASSSTAMSGGTTAAAARHGCRYFATGSEDTTIRIWARCSEVMSREAAAEPRSLLPPLPPPSPRCVASIKIHGTGIQALQWCATRMTTYLLSSGGSEDFFVLCAGALATGGDMVTNPTTTTTLFCEAALPDKTPAGDLRITDFDARVQPKGRGSSDNGAGRVGRGQGGGEEEAPDFLVIAMGFSNSVLKVYLYRPPPARMIKARSPSSKEEFPVSDAAWSNRGVGDERFELLSSGMYTGACITQVKHLDDGCVVTASTDGHIALWTTQGSELVLRLTIRVHQSSIKGMALVQAQDASTLPDGCSWLAVTTGDDNAIGFTSFRGPNVVANDGSNGREDDGCRYHKTVIQSAHAAAINGVVALESGGEPGVPWRFATVSNDQRVKVWQVELRGETTENRIQARLLRDFSSAVADAGTVEAFGKDKIIVGGVGMEIWDLALGGQGTLGTA